MDVITRFYNLQDFSGGNNIIYNPKQIGETQTQRTMNLVPYAKGVLEKKKGSILYKEISGASKINALKVAEISGDVYIIAVANFSGTGAEDKIYFSKNGDDFAEMTGTTTLTAGSDYTIAVDNLGYIYISNGTDNIQVSTDGETRSDITFTTGSLTPNGKFLCWWKDRLWVADESNSSIYFSDNLDPTTFQPANVLQCGGHDTADPITGITPMSMTTATEGLMDVLVVFKKNSIWIIGFDTEPSYIDQLSGVIGCWDSKSIVSTPMGIMFVGKDNVYSLGRSGEPTPIGTSIKPVWDGSDIYRGRNKTIRTATAIYFNGFVMFAYPESSSSYNDREYYLDIRDYSNIGWFGDHTGRNISCYTTYNNVLYAGDSNNGKVWILEQETRKEDIGGAGEEDISVELITRSYTLDGSEFTTKIFKRFGFNVLASNNADLVINWDIDDGSLVGSAMFNISGVSGALFDVDYWDNAFFYGGNIFTQLKHIFRHDYRGKYIFFTIKEDSSANIKIANGVLSYILTGRVL